MEFIIAVDNAKLRERLVRILQSIGHEPAVVGDARHAYHMDPQRLNDGWLLLETNDNVHLLTQIVNDLRYSPLYSGSTVPVTCFVSRKAFNQNPSLGFWLIAGNAAVGMVWMTEMPDHEMVPAFKRINAGPLESPARWDPARSDRPEAAAVVEQIGGDPGAATGWVCLAEALMERQDLWTARSEVCAVLLRKAVELDPSSARARVRLGKALFWLHQSDEAIGQCREAVRLDPTYAEAHFQLGSLLSDARDNRESRQHLETAIRLAGDSHIGVWARNVLASHKGVF